MLERALVNLTSPHKNEGLNAGAGVEWRERLVDNGLEWSVG